MAGHFDSPIGPFRGDPREQLLAACRHLTEFTRRFGNVDRAGCSKVRVVCSTRRLRIEESPVDRQLQRAYTRVYNSVS